MNDKIKTIILVLGTLIASGLLTWSMSGTMKDINAESGNFHWGYFTISTFLFLCLNVGLPALVFWIISWFSRVFYKSAFLIAGLTIQGFLLLCITPWAMMMHNKSFLSPEVKQQQLKIKNDSTMDVEEINDSFPVKE